MAFAVVFVALMGLIVLAQIGRVLLSLVKNSPRIAKYLHAALLQIRRKGAKKEDVESDEALKVQVQKELNARRLRFAKRGLTWGSVLACGLAADWVRYALSEPHWLTSPPTSRKIIALVGFMCWTLVDIKKDMLTLRALHILHVFFMSLLILFSLVVLVDLEELFKERGNFLLMGIALGLMHIDVRISCCTNLALFLSLAYTSTTVPSQCNALSALRFVIHEFVFFFAKASLFYWVESMVISSITLELRARSLRSHKFAASSLLQRVCDAVVELDGDRRFVEHSPSLASMLFHGPGKSHTGMLMQDLMHSDDDKLLFNTSLSACDDNGEAPGATMFHANTRDSWGNAVSMEFFHVSYPGHDEQETYHLIGVRGQQDEPFNPSLLHKFCETCRQTVLSAHQTVDAVPAAISAGVLGGAASGNDGVPQARLRDNFDAAALERHRGRAKPSSGSSHHSEDMDKERVADVVAVDSLPISYSSTKFKATYGVSDTFLGLVPEQERYAFQLWVLSTADEVWGGSRRPQVEDFGCLALADAAQQRPRKISAYFPDPQAEANPNGRAKYRVSIHIGRTVRGGSRGNASNGRGTSATPSVHGDLGGAALEPSTIGAKATSVGL